jgi:hypothetical protein
MVAGNSAIQTNSCGCGTIVAVEQHKGSGHVQFQRRRRSRAAAAATTNLHERSDPSCCTVPPLHSVHRHHSTNAVCACFLITIASCPAPRRDHRASLTPVLATSAPGQVQPAEMLQLCRRDSRLQCGMISWPFRHLLCTSLPGAAWCGSGTTVLRLLDLWIRTTAGWKGHSWEGWAGARAECTHLCGGFHALEMNLNDIH